MFTRKDRLQNKCSHREFWGQFVTNQGKWVVAGLIQQFPNAQKPSDIPLKYWDKLNPSVNMKILEAAGLKGLSLADRVCISKETFRQIKES